MDKIRRFLDSWIAKAINFLIGPVALFYALFEDNKVIVYVFLGVWAIFLVLAGVKFLKQYAWFQEKKALFLADSVVRRKANADNLNDIAYVIKNAMVEELKVYSEKGIESKAEKIIGQIEAFFRGFLQTEVSVCIKQIKVNSIFNEEIDNWKITTLARSSKTASSRCKRDVKPVLVKDNTDFQIILSDKTNDEIFASANLEKTQNDYNSRNEVFKNSTPNYLSIYRSTIVVPIRIELKFISENLSRLIDSSKDKEGFHILGFLCIDSMETFDKNIDEFEIAVKKAIAIADLLYPLFEKYLISQLGI